MIAIPRKPSIKLFCQRTNKRNREDPCNEFPLGERIDNLLDCRSALPGFAVTRTNELDRFEIRARRNPRKARADARSLRGKNLQLMMFVPLLQDSNELLAHVAVAVVDN